MNSWVSTKLEMSSPTALAIAKRSFNADTESIRGIASMGMQALSLYYDTDESREGAAAFLELEALAAAAPGAGEFIGKPRESEYLASQSGRLLFVGVMPAKDFSSLGVIEGPLTDVSNAFTVSSTSDDRLVGDVDDVISLVEVEERVDGP